MKKFLGITLVLLLGISLLGGCSEQNQQNTQVIDESQPMEQFISTDDKELDNPLRNIDYDLNYLQSNNENSSIE